MNRPNLLLLAAALALTGCETRSACEAPAIPVGVTGAHLIVDTTDLADHSSSTCGGLGTPDWVGVFTAPAAGFYRVSTQNPGTNYDTILSFFWECEDPVESQLACNVGEGGRGEFTDLWLAAGQPIYVAVDGAGEVGTFELTVDDDQGLELDREDIQVVPPSGVAVAFRAITPEGDPVPRLGLDDVVVLNDETGRPFSASAEGGAAHTLGENDAVEAHSILVLDFSSSIFNAGSAPEVVRGAQAYIDASLLAAEGGLPHKLSIVAFGAPDRTEQIIGFTDDQAALHAALDTALTAGNRGTTDLYGAYIEAVHLVDAQGSEHTLTDRFVVLLTDGTHEAGDTAQRRSEALTAQRGSDATIFALGIDGDYDADRLRELASRNAHFFQVAESDGLVDAFEDAAERTLALSRSNYVVGICTPVALGEPTVTLQVTSGNDVAELTLPYPTEELSGEIQGCDPGEVADAAFPPAGP